MNTPNVSFAFGNKLIINWMLFF